MITREDLERYIRYCGYDLDSGKYVYKNLENNVPKFYSERDLIQAEKLVALFGSLEVAQRLSPKADEKGVITGFDPKSLGFALLSYYNESKRLYDPSRERGLGVWLDRLDGNERVMVMNLGDKLLVNNDIQPLASNLGYEYNRYLPISLPEDRPLLDSEGELIKETLQKFDWAGTRSKDGKLSLNGTFLAGWVGVSMIGGGLPWRPHCWITGQAGSGKSTCHMVASSLISVFSEMLQGSTTEAAVRQSLTTHAKPVLFDETDSTDKHARDQLKRVLSLIRTSSTETGAQTRRGSASGKVVRYDIRSMFLLGATVDFLELQQDKERFTILEMKKNEDPAKRKQQEDFVKAQKNKFEVESFSGKLLKRQLENFWNIIESIKVFDNAFTNEGIIRDRRISQHYGILMAGEWSLTHSKTPTKEEAIDSIMRFEWDNFDQVAAVEEDKTPDQLLDYLLHYPIDIPRVKEGFGGMKISIGEALYHALITSVSDSLGKDCKKALARYGLKALEGGKLFISNNHSLLQKIFSETSYVKDWNKVLVRVAKAIKVEKNATLGGKPVRGIIIPIEEWKSFGDDVKLEVKDTGLAEKISSGNNNEDEDEEIYF